MSSLQAQNAVTASGVFQEGPERISVRVSGEFASEASLKAINLRINDRFFPLTDVATITRGYVDPPTTLFRFNGQPAIALAIGMKSGANLLKFGEALKEEMSKIVADLPIGSGGPSRGGSTGRRRTCRVGFHGSAVRGGSYRSWHQLSQPRDFERVSSSRSRYHWFSQSRSSSWRLPVFRCSAFRWEH